MSDEDDLFWIVAKTKPNMERTAEWNVRNQGFECWLPMGRKEQGKGMVPLYPGYLFVRTHGPWFFLKGTKGVREPIFSLDSAGNPAPTRVPDSIMDDTRLYAEQASEIPPANGLAINRLVTIAKGAWESHIGVYKGDDKHGKRLVVIHLLGKDQQISFDSEVVVPL